MKREQTQYLACQRRAVRGEKMHALKQRTQRRVSESVVVRV